MSNGLCEVLNCDRPLAAKGFCHLHYNRNQRHGDPLVAHRMLPRGSSLAERMLKLAPPRNPDECWEWQGTIHYTGYGTMTIMGEQRGAHVWAYVNAHGDAPEGMNVLHSCDNKPCVNPAHLRVGTHQDNMDDKVKRDRCSRLRGEHAPSVKLSEMQAVEIIRRHGIDRVPTKTLARKYGISKSQIRNIVTGKQWSHLDRAAILKEKVKTIEVAP